MRAYFYGSAFRRPRFSVRTCLGFPFGREVRCDLCYRSRDFTDFFCAVPTMLNIICVLSLSGVYFKLVKDYKARYMGIGKIDPDFKPFFEDEVKK